MKTYTVYEREYKHGKPGYVYSPKCFNGLSEARKYVSERGNGAKLHYSYDTKGFYAISRPYNPLNGSEFIVKR